MKWLSLEEQMIIYSHFFDELSERQIAEKLSISKTAFHYRKQKILIKLKKILDQYGI
ncbi:sigma factor-like helix-turn-helix DNA-binding protein [[Eubacterium] hominis]|uniref:sigma factor-like helix-turn-helix DNA-binding protein n=1 Tax=[Eubacterium] hominis TaxID=2764325 RepID=UPI003A4D4DC1